MTLPCAAPEPERFLPPSPFPGSYVVPLSCYIFWTLAYVLIIRRGFKERTYGMPALALCANFAWEVLFSLYPAPYKLNHYGNVIWIIADVLILYTCLRFGPAEVTEPLLKRWFRLLTLAGVAYVFVLEWAFVCQGQDSYGIVIGFAQDLLMAALFLGMYRKRDSLRGQSFWIALGILLGNAGAYFYFLWFPLPLPPPPWPSTPLVTLLYVPTALLNGIYTVVIWKRCRRQGINPWKNF
jgi:hypothetical protein